MGKTKRTKATRAKPAPKGKHPLVELLVASGAEVARRCKAGKTAADYTRADIAALLR